MKGSEEEKGNEVSEGREGLERKKKEEKGTTRKEKERKRKEKGRKRIEKGSEGGERKKETERERK